MVLRTEQTLTGPVRALNRCVAYYLVAAFLLAGVIPAVAAVPPPVPPISCGNNSVNNTCGTDLLGKEEWGVLQELEKNLAEREAQLKEEEDANAKRLDAERAQLKDAEKKEDVAQKVETERDRQEREMEINRMAELVAQHEAQERTYRDIVRGAEAESLERNLAELMDQIKEVEKTIQLNAERRTQWEAEWKALHEEEIKSMKENRAKLESEKMVQALKDEYKRNGTIYWPLFSPIDLCS